MEHFDAEEFLRLVEKYKVTTAQLVPTMFVRMLKLPEEVRSRYDVSSLRGAIHAAAPCPIDGQGADDRLVGADPDRVLRRHRGQRRHLSTSQRMAAANGLGRPRAWSARCSIFDEDGKELPPGETGTVYFADAPAFEYHNDPEKTAKRATTPGAGRRSATSATSTTTATSTSPTASPS